MRRRWGSMNKKKLLSGPYFVWMILFTIVPLLVIAWYGFTDRTGAFTLANVKAIASPEHLKALGLSLSLSIAACYDFKKIRHGQERLCCIYLYPADVDEFFASYLRMVKSS